MTDNANNASGSGDVLGSIRRLMSDGSAVPQTRGRDKLVLTEDQRVPAGRGKGRDSADEVERIARELLRRPTAKPETKTPDPSPTLLTELKAVVEAPAPDPVPAPAPAPEPVEAAEVVTPRPAPHVSLDDKIAALEKILGTKKDDPAPQPEEAVDDGPNVIRLVHSATGRPNSLSDDELREMVSQIVREELQGVLGEKITRNVRKLVRREIQRAIMDRDLD